MRLRAALEGNLEQFMEDEIKTAELAVTRGVRSAGEATKAALRSDVVGAGLGRRLSTSWRVKHYPRSGASLGATAFIYTRAKKLIDAFDRGVTIRSTEGFWLAIPTDAAPKRGVGRKRLTPSNFPEHVHGPLRFVYRKSGPSLLVVDNMRVTKSGRYRQNIVRSKRGHYSRLEGRTTVPMFLLYPQVKLKRRLDVRKTMDAGAATVIPEIDAAFDVIDAQKRRR